MVGLSIELGQSGGGRGKPEVWVNKSRSVILRADGSETTTLVSLASIWP